ncbi:MAG: TRAP transporter TatT component family protein [Zoogloea sp.]|uniref:TRAP transporter TatT component family protein n=1 Tax=Zoogloea sp. TaxID=49181 RepID=UPI0026294FEB|nr:TRAP transporter TatT component family protein [Zoogloea sp.]MDD3327988.1 TRAP transporter TatT component family protein [Zoogloea sp.]
MAHHRRPALPRLMHGLAVLAAALLLSACTPRQLILGQLADELAAQGQASETDLELARDAAPYHLKLSEAVLRAQPGHAGLAAATAAGFTQYAYAFVAFEADRLDATDARAADSLRRRAARLYQRGRDHALAALEARQPGFAATLAQPGAALRLEADDIPLAYWGAAAWGGLISLSKDAPDTVADLPLAIRLAEHAWRTDPGFGDGMLASLMGSFEVARPGGSPARAAELFDDAIRLSGGRSAGAWVAKAEGIAQPAGDKAAFVALLQQALAVPDAAGSPHALANEVMRRRARWLLGNADDLF